MQLDNSKIVSARFAIAFVKYSGLAKLLPSIHKSIDEGGEIEFIVGLDFKTTDAKSLTEFDKLSSNPKFRYFCFSDPAIDNSPIFHPKLYILEYENGLHRVVIGSSNLTAGGLEKNIEVNTVIETTSQSEILSVQEIYHRIRQRETLFTPDKDYINSYQALYKEIQSKTKGVFAKKKVQENIEKLRAIEAKLPGPAPTQIDLIVEAIQHSPKNQEGYVNLSAMQKFIRSRAQELNLNWEMPTLENSIRGRLNTHSIGKNGLDLFERRKGQGLYKLSENGLKYKARKIV